RDPAPLRSLVPRPRRAAAAGRVGLDGRGGHAVLPVVVDRHLPRPRHLHDRARVQLPRRQPARRLRPADRALRRRQPVSLLEVEDVRVDLPGARGPLTIVDGVDYDIRRGEIFGIAGESGSGKTMSMLALLGLLPDGASVSGAARFEGTDLLTLPRSRR